MPVVREPAVIHDGIYDTGMHKVSIIAKLSKFDQLKSVLNDLGVTGMTVTQVMGCGIQKGTTEKYRGVPVDSTLLPKIKVEVIVSKISVDSVVEAAKKAWIYCSPFSFFLIIPNTAQSPAPSHKGAGLWRFLTVPVRRAIFVGRI